MLSTAEIAAIEARAARWLLSSFDTAAMRQGAFALIGQSLPALLASHAALTARLAAVVGERALLITVAEWASTLRRRAQSHEDERLYDQAVARLDGALYALMRYRQARRLEPPDGR